MWFTQSRIKDLLTRIGGRCPERVIEGVNSAHNFVDVGHWFRQRGLAIPARSQTRDALFESVGATVAGRRVLYLEFGVASGKSMRIWSRLLTHPETRLHGFDSFVGLPRSWGRLPQGYFSTDGVPPSIDDPRVEFFVGPFSETLPRYVPPDHDCLVVVVDADLYSSTKVVLDAVRPFVQVGSYLYFDEFHHICDERRAFEEFVEETGAGFEVVGATLGLTGVFLRRVT